MIDQNFFSLLLIGRKKNRLKYANFPDRPVVSFPKPSVGYPRPLGAMCPDGFGRGALIRDEFADMTRKAGPTTKPALHSTAAGPWPVDGLRHPDLPGLLAPAPAPPSGVGAFCAAGLWVSGLYPTRRHRPPCYRTGYVRGTRRRAHSTRR
jgi:hypothetical protein